MARTFHHCRGAGRSPRFPDGSPAWYRRWLNQRYRARVAHLVRVERYEKITPPKRDASWFW